MSNSLEKYKEVKTIKELYDFLGECIKEGHSNRALYFDTDAKTFDYHLAQIEAVSVLPEEYFGECILCFYEK